MRLLLEICGLPIFFRIGKVPRVLVQQEETNLMCGGPLFTRFKVLLIFFGISFLILFVYQREVLYQVLECILMV